MIGGQGFQQEAEKRGLEPYRAAQALRPNPASSFPRLSSCSSCLALARDARTAEPPDVHQPHFCPVPSQGLTSPAPGILSDSQ